MNQHSRCIKSILIVVAAFSLVILLAILLSQSAAPIAQASPSVYTVDRNDDAASATACVDANANDCSFRGAIIAANANAGSTINVPAGTYWLTNTASGDINIYTTTIIAGAGLSTTIISGGPGWDNRILNIKGPTQISGVTIRHGIRLGSGGGGLLNISRLSINDSAIVSNTSNSYGGGIYNSGVLTITNSRFTLNASKYGALYSSAGASLFLSHVDFLTNTASDLAGALMIGNSPAVSVTLDHLTFISNTGSWGGAFWCDNCRASLNDSLFRNNTAVVYGGAIVANGPLAKLTLNNAQILRNLAQNGGGIQNFSTITVNTSLIALNDTCCAGGGIYNSLSSTLIIKNSIISTNTSHSNGGGLDNEGITFIEDSLFISNTQTSTSYQGGAINNNGPLSITNSRLINNTSLGVGGGIFNLQKGVATITLSTIAGNSSQWAGGIENYYSGTLIIDRSTINGNRAFNSSGGGIFNLSVMTVTNSTLSGNSATYSGGGIDAETSVASTYLENVTLVNNQADSDLNSSGVGGGLYTNGNPFKVLNTLIAQNLQAGTASDCNGAIMSLGYNFIQTTTGCTISNTLTGLISNTNPLLTPLQNFGGSTWTHGLIKDSPAIDAGDPVNCLAVDQRGVARPIGLHCDIGAFEGTIWLVYLPIILK
jgi:hypothetical protein